MKEESEEPKERVTGTEVAALVAVMVAVMVVVVVIVYLFSTGVAYLLNRQEESVGSEPGTNVVGVGITE